VLKSTYQRGAVQLEVIVFVIDTQVPGPVADAKVTIFHGLRTPLENTRFMNRIPPSKFLPDPNSPYTQTNSTDSYGMCSFQYQFTAITSDSWFHHTGNVRVQEAWVQISAAGRPDALVPIDRQGIYPRDIHDKSPIVVSVVMNRCKEQDASE